MATKSKRKLKRTLQNSSLKLEKQDKKMAVIYGIVIFAFAFLLYVSTIPYELVYFDDDRLIVHKKDFNSKMSSIPEAFDKTIGVTYYRPILMITFILDYQLGELETPQYRFTNVMLHAFASLLAFVMLIYLRYPPWASFLFAMLLAAHPVLTPAAAWISGRNDSLITIFTLLSFITMIAFLEGKGGRKWMIFLVHLIMYTINLFTKESAAFFPIMGIIYIYMFRRKILFKSDSMALVVSWFIIGLIWFSMREGALPPGDSPDEISLAAYLANLPALIALIGKTFFPLKMSAIANFEWVSLTAGAIAIIAITSIYVWKNKRIDGRKMLFGLLWLVIFLTPTLLVRIKIDYFDYAEHRLYLPFLGILIILIEIAKGLKINFKNKITVGIAIFLILLFGARSFSYARAFENGKEFWAHFVKQYRENEMGNFNLAEIFFFKNDTRRANIFYDRALQFDEKNRVHNFIQMTQPSFLVPKDQPDYKSTFSEDDLNKITLYNYLANRYYLKQNVEESIKYSEKALRIRRDDPYANFLLGRSLNAVRRPEQAIKYLEIANNRMNNWSWKSQLGIAYFRVNNFEKAYQAFSNATQLNPKSSRLFLNLGSAATKLKNFEEAEQAYARSINLDARNQQAYVTIISFYLDVKKDMNKAKYYYNLARQRNIQIPENLSVRIK